MPARVSFDYAPIWVVPRVERDERLAVGAVLRCLARDFLEARLHLDTARLQAIAAGIDAALIERHLEAILRVCAGGPAAGPVGALNQRERWHWLTAPRSAVIQIGPVHVGLCEDPSLALDRLVAGLCG